jgi:hypothetical protein
LFCLVVSLFYDTFLLKHFISSFSIFLHSSTHFIFSPRLPLSSSHDQLDLQALIEETEALKWDSPEQLDVEDNLLGHEGFALIGKIISPKPLHAQLVRTTMASAWSFASPLAVETLAPNKFLFDVPLQSHVDRITQQGPWNIRGSLLILQPWAADLALEEVDLHSCSFWIQVHGLPMHNMNHRNAVRIGKALGKLLEVENLGSVGLICRQHLNLRVVLNTDLPLVPGFLIPRPDKEPLWVSFKYERLADYCSLCGLIGHRNFYCPTAISNIPLENFGMSLKAVASTSPRPVSTGVFEASGYGNTSDVVPPASPVFSDPGNSSGCTAGQIIKASFAHHVASPYQNSRLSTGSSRLVPLNSNPFDLGHSQMDTSTAVWSPPTQYPTTPTPSAKGKSLMYATSPTTLPLPYPLINADEFAYPILFPAKHIVTQIQSNLVHFEPPQSAQFQDFLSHWANIPSKPNPFTRPGLSITENPPCLKKQEPMVLSTDFPKPNPAKLQSTPVLAQSSQSHSSPTSPLIISSSEPTVSLSQKSEHLSLSPQPICNKKPITPASKISRFHPFFPKSLSPSSQPSSPPRASVTSPPPAPSPPLSPDISLIKKKRSTYTEDTEPIVFLKKPKISRKSHSDSPSQMELAAISLTAMQYSNLPMETSVTPPFQPGLTDLSSDLTHFGSNSGFLNRPGKGALPSVQVVTSTQALMVDPPLIRRRFLRSSSGRNYPAIYSDVFQKVSGSASTASSTSTEVSPAGPPPPT